MTFNKLSTSRRRWVRVAAVLAAGAAALGATGMAQAGSNVFWSVGVASPGVQLAVANGPQFYAQPAPVYLQPAPVYVQPAPVYMQPAPVYYRPARVVVPAPVYYGPGRAYRQVTWVQPGHGHGHHNGPRHGQGNGYRYGNGYGYPVNAEHGIGYGP